jgi:polyhydroxyalkanoate synthesis regulator phasin
VTRAEIADFIDSQIDPARVAPGTKAVITMDQLDWLAVVHRMREPTVSRSEMALLRERVDTLEKRVAVLESI